MSEIQRTFIAGDEWLYYKIYAGISTVDNLLATEILPLTEKLLSNKYIDKWFFIRYTDPDYHLRLRFHLTNNQNTSAIISSVNFLLKPYVQDGLVSKVQLDTYKRELERYGMKNIEHSESLFYHDSVLVANALKVLNNNQFGELRWLFCLKSIDKLLSDFQFSTVSKLELMEYLKNAFASEFNMDKSLKKQLSQKYQKYKLKINQILSDDIVQEESKYLVNLLQERSDMISKIYLPIIKNVQFSNDTLSNVLASYIHMHCNRLIRSKQRLHEMVIYDLLYQKYKSEIARLKYAQ